MIFTLAVCSEMVYLDLPHLDRMRRINDHGSPPKIWGWVDRDAAALVATGARFTPMTGYLRGDLVTESGSADLLATAEQAVPFAHAIRCPSLNLHGTGLGRGRPARLVGERGDRADAVGRPLRAGVGQAGPRARCGQPATADEPRPLPRADRRERPRRTDPPGRPVGRGGPGRRRAWSLRADDRGGALGLLGPGPGRRRLRRRRGDGGIRVPTRCRGLRPGPPALPTRLHLPNSPGSQLRKLPAAGRPVGAPPAAFASRGGSQAQSFCGKPRFRPPWLGSSQRWVTTLPRVKKCTPSLPCAWVSPKSEFFHPPKE